MHVSNRMSGIVLALIACAVLVLQAASAETGTKSIVLQPGPEGTDAYICECKPETNSPNGGQGVLYQGQYLPTCYDRLLIQWDLSALPKGAAIIGAEMELYCTGIYGAREGRMAYYRIAGLWEEEKVNFNNQPNYVEEGGVLTDWPGPNAWLGVDITAFVRGWYEGTFPNYGVYGHCVKRASGRCVASFVPSDDPSAILRPKLTVVYK